MKSNHIKTRAFRGSFLARVQVLTTIACFASVSLSAQDTGEGSSPDFAANIASIRSESAAAESATIPEREARSPINVADIVELPAATGRSLSPAMPAVFAAYLPARDTNVGIGVWYPSGSSDFIYLVAGKRPPGGDPRLPPVNSPATSEALTVPVASEAPVVFESAEIGMRAVMVRGGGDAVQIFPPGAFVRRSGPGESIAATALKSPQRGTPLYYKLATKNEKGEDLIFNFPPGSTLIKVPISIAEQ